MIQTTAAISPGSSGGGLFDASGRLLGITTSRIPEGENLAFALSADLIAGLVEGAIGEAGRWLALASAYAEAGFGGDEHRRELAREAAANAVRLTPSNAEAWCALGDLEEDLKRRIDCVETATKADPSLAEAWLRLGSSLASAARLCSPLYGLGAKVSDQRERDKWRLLEQNPTVSELLRGTHPSQLFELGRFLGSGATAALERARAIDPADVEVLHELASHYLGFGMYRHAEVVAREATALDPACVETLWQLFDAAVMQGHRDEAEGLYRRMLELPTARSEDLLSIQAACEALYGAADLQSCQQYQTRWRVASRRESDEWNLRREARRNEVEALLPLLTANSREQ